MYAQAESPDGFRELRDSIGVGRVLVLGIERQARQFESSELGHLADGNRQFPEYRSVTAPFENGHRLAGAQMAHQRAVSGAAQAWAHVGSFAAWRSKTPSCRMYCAKCASADSLDGK